MSARCVPIVAAGCALAVAIAGLTAPTGASAERTFSYDTPVLETAVAVGAARRQSESVMRTIAPRP